MTSRIPLALFLAMALAAFAAGQTAPRSQDLSLLLGRGELLQFNADIVRVAVAEPKVADAVVVSPREVMVNAKSPGYTTIVIWETGQAPARYNVQVLADTAETDAARKRVRDQLKDFGVDATVNGESVILTGEVKHPDDGKRAEAAAAGLARTVINLLKVATPAEPKQILLQVKFASVDRAALSELGFNWFSRNDKTLGMLSNQQFATPRFSQLQFQDQEFANSTLNFSDLLNLFIYRPDLNIGATIRALQSRNLLQILAEPNLIAIEGREASFLAGGQFPFPVLTATSTGGSIAPVITVQFKNFGVELNFTPSLTPQGSIHLKVSPEVSSLDFANAVTLQGFLIPALTTRRASTEVVLKDGESFAIAGLLDSRVVQTLSRVRGLGDIPILGHLFRSRSTRKTQDELLVVITPRFVKPLTPEERAKLPPTIEPFLPTAEEEMAHKNQKGKKGTRGKQPVYSGPTGHQEPPATPAKK